MYIFHVLFMYVQRVCGRAGGMVVDRSGTRSAEAAYRRHQRLVRPNSLRIPQRLPLPVTYMANGIVLLVGPRNVTREKRYNNIIFSSVLLCCFLCKTHTRYADSSFASISGVSGATSCTANRR